MEGNTAGAKAPQAEQATSVRRYEVFFALSHSASVHAGLSGLQQHPDRAITLLSGESCAGEFMRRMSVAGARELAAALIAAADHYDAETARLAQVGGA